MTLTAGQVFVSTGRGSEVTATDPNDLYDAFAYTLVAPALTTSAAVYDANGVLQKTLWSALTQTAGTHTGYWAGDMDDGTPATGTPPFRARVLAHNVEYVWEGVIGNLSSSFTSSAVMVGLNNPVQSLSISGTNLWVSVGYNESKQTCAQFALSDPNTRAGGMLKDQGISPNSIATDATQLYWATGGGYGNSKCFVGVQNLATGNNVSMASGTPVTLYAGTYSALSLYDSNPVVTISIASPAVVTVANRFVAGAAIKFSTTGALPTGITAGTTYYVIATGLSTSSFQFSATPGGAAVNTSGSQSGQQKMSAGGIAPTGISVSASYIAVSHPAFGVVDVLDISTGALVNSVTVAALNSAAQLCNQIAFDPSGNLWVISGTSVVEYTSPGSSSATGTTITGFANPLAVATDSSGNVWVADGNTVQQVFKYDSAGALQATFGTAGGYMTDSTVSTSKLWFYWPNATWTQHTAICPDDSGGVWVGDSGNMRTLHFTSGGTCDKVMQWSMAAYNVRVDHTNPTRVFAGFLEYAVDYTEPLTAGATAAWTLVRNWTAGGPSGPFSVTGIGTSYQFREVETLSNGRCYGIAGRSGSYTPYRDVYELPSSGGLARYCVAIPGPADGGYPYEMAENGDLRHITISPVAPGSTEYFYVSALTGFDGSNNPVWGADTLAGSVVATTVNMPWIRGGGFGGSGALPITSGNVIVTYDPTTVTGGNGNQGYHLGGVALNGTGYSWMAAPTGPLNGKGNFQTKAVDGTVNYGGGSCSAFQRHVWYSYHGENYTDQTWHQIGQANQFMHYYDDGLFIGQFGVPNIAHFHPEGTYPAGCAGNSFSNTYAYANGNLYWYHGDENVHGGIHRWRIDGIDTISEQDFTLVATPAGS